MQPTTHSILLVALLPQPIQLRDIPAPQRVELQAHDRKVMQSVLHFLLRPLMDPDTRQCIGYCANGHYQKCHLVLSGWVADYPKHIALQNHGYGFCPWCEVPKDKLGGQVNTLSLLRDHRLYQALYDIAKCTKSNSAPPVADISIQDSKYIIEGSREQVQN
jgi:hypothetical protein